LFIIYVIAAQIKKGAAAPLLWSRRLN